MQDSYDYDWLSDLISELNLSVSAAHVHGSLVGYLCAGGEMHTRATLDEALSEEHDGMVAPNAPVAHWIAVVLDEHDLELPDGTESELDGFAQATIKLLAQAEMRMELLLPNDVRDLSILTGVGVSLHMGSEDIELFELGTNSDPLAFDGATPVHCILLGGPVQDLNLMLRADGHLGHMRRISGVERTVITDAKIIAIYSVNSPAVLWLNGERIELQASSLAWQALSAGAELIIKASNVVLMEVMQVG